MYEIDPSRTDLADEFRNNPDGPYSPELTLIVNRLRLIPTADRHMLVVTQRGREWILAKMPAKRGEKVKLYKDRVFTNYEEGIWAVFKMRWETVTGEKLA